MQTIKIAELSIDNKKLLNELQATKSSIDSLTKTQKDLKDAGETSSKVFIQNEADLKNLNSTYNSQIKVLQATTGANEKLTSALNQEITSVDAAKQNNAELVKVRNQINWSTKEGATAIVEINKKIDLNNTKINAGSSALEKQKQQIGDYSKGLLNTNPILSQMASTLTTVRDGLVAKNAAMKASAVSTGGASAALRIFKLALISTGIGAIVVVLGSLITYLSTTQKGIDAVTSATRPLQAIFSSLIGVVQTLGEKLSGAFTSPKQAMIDIAEFVKTNLINRFKAFGVILEAIQNRDFKALANGFLQVGTGVENVIDKAKEAGKATGKFFSEAAKKGAEIDALIKNIEQSENDLIVTRAKNLKQIKEQELIAKDTTKSAKERNDATAEAIRLSDELSKAELGLIDKKIKQKELEHSLNDTSRADDKELAQLQADRFAAEEAADARTLKFIGTKNSLSKEGEANAIAVIDNVIKNLEDEAKLYEAQQSMKNQSDAERLASIQASNDKEKEILDIKLKNGLLSETEYQTAKLGLDKKYLEAKATMAEDELARIQDFEDRKKELTDEIYLAGLEDEEEKVTVALELELEQDLLELEKLELDETKKNELKELLETAHQQKLTKIKTDGAKKRADEEKKIDEDLLKAKTAIAQARLDVANGLSALLTSVAGDNAEVQTAALLIEKGVAAARIIIATQVANLQAIASSPMTGGMPWVAYNYVMMGLGLAAIAAQTVTGIGKISQSNKSSKKLARGGILNGPSHAQGGIQTPFGELEGGEAVINRRSTRMYAPILSEINQAGGGVRFANGGILGSAKMPTTMIDYDLLAGKMAQANSTLPSPVVSVEEISSVSNRVSTIETTATF